MKQYIFPRHSMIVKSVDYMEKIKTIEQLKAENTQLHANINAQKVVIDKLKEALKDCIQWFNTLEKMRIRRGLITMGDEFYNKSVKPLENLLNNPL